jgi:hypothetical protein
MLGTVNEVNFIGAVTFEFHITAQSAIRWSNINAVQHGGQ